MNKQFTKEELENEMTRLEKEQSALIDSFGELLVNEEFGKVLKDIKLPGYEQTH